MVPWPATFNTLEGDMGIAKNTFIFTSLDDRYAFIEMIIDRNLNSVSDYTVAPGAPRRKGEYTVLMKNKDAVEVAEAVCTEYSISVDRL